MKINRYYPSRLISCMCMAILALGATTANAQQKEPETFASIITFTKGEALRAADAASILAERLHLNPTTDELRSAYIEQPGDGLQVQRFHQYFKGIKVAHGSFALSSKDGIASYAFGKFYNIPTTVSNTPVISEADALAKALAKIDATKYFWEGDPSNYPKAKLEFVEDWNTEALDDVQHLAYAFDIYAEAPLSRNMVYVDAQTGRILFMDAILKHVNATGASLYSDTVSFVAGLVGGNYLLTDSSRGNGVHTYSLNHTTSTNFTTNTSIAQNTSTTNFFARDPAVDAHWGAEQVYDYWKNTHNRLSWNGTNGTLNSFVHYSTSYNNAMWNGAAMVYGDGSGTASGGLNPLTALDVCGHEIGHGVCQSTAALVYSRESGAMNEGFSDIWGSVIEAYADPHEIDAMPKDKWLIGEEIGMTLRSMRNPKLYDQPDTYQGINWINASPSCATSVDNCGVHTNSGVLNYWFYLISEGGKGTNDLGNNYKVISITMAKAAKIAYATELVLNSNATYADCRTASIAAATTLYGACSAEVEQITRAWYAVGVGSNYTPCTPQVSFTDISSSVSEDAVTNACHPTHIVNIPVVLNGPALTGDSAVVTATVIGGTAIAGLDFALTTPSVSFLIGGPTTKNIALTVFDNGTINPNKYVDLVYTLTAGASNASRSLVQDTTRVFIANDDVVPDLGGPELHTALTYSSPSNLGSPVMSNAVAARAQYIYKASELIAAGIRPNAPITQAEFFVSSKYSTQPFTGYTMQMANTPQSSLSTGFVTGPFTTVYSANLTTSVGWNPLSFVTPFVWNGTDNIAVEVCFTNGTRDLSNDRVQSEVGSFTLAAYASSNSGASGCTLPFNVNSLVGTRPLLRFSQNVPPSPVATALNANRIWEVKAGQQVYFYTDSTNGKKLISAVFNPSADLGCVSTTVTAAGTGFVQPNGGRARSVKEWSITASQNPSAPHFEAIFYITNTEMAGIDPNKIQIVQTNTLNDSNITTSNSEIVTPSDIIYGQDYIGFRGSFNGFNRFFLTGENLGLAVGGIKSAGTALWTGANPFQIAPLLYWNLQRDEYVSIRMFDVTGKIVYNTERTLAAGTHNISISGNIDYAPGTYVLQVVRASGVFTRQLVKQ